MVQNLYTKSGLTNSFIGSMLKYTNGVGHLIMSIVGIAAGLILILIPMGVDTSLRGIGVSIIITVMNAWFIPGAAKQVVQAIDETKQQQDNKS